MQSAIARPNSWFAANSEKQSMWILNGPIDLLLSCGGIIWILLAIHAALIVLGGSGFSFNSSQQLFLLVTIIGTHALSETHTVATLARAYKDEDTRRRYALQTRWLALAAVGLLLAGLHFKGVTPFLSRIYLLWVIQHFTAQTYGLALIYCFKSGYRLSLWEKRSIGALLNCTALMAIVRQLTFTEWSANGFLAQNIPMWGPLPEWIFQTTVVMLEVSAYAFVFMVLRKLVRERVFIPLPAALMLVTGVSIFCFGRDVAGIMWLYVPAFYHGAQYLVITTAQFLKERQSDKSMADSSADVDSRSAPVTNAMLTRLLTSSDCLKYLGQLLVVALFIYVGIPRLLQELGFDYTRAFASVFVAVNLHHFVTDMAIWKLRDPNLRKSVVS